MVEEKNPPSLHKLDQSKRQSNDSPFSGSSALAMVRTLRSVLISNRWMGGKAPEPALFACVGIGRQRAKALPLLAVPKAASLLRLKAFGAWCRPSLSGIRRLSVTSKRPLSIPTWESSESNTSTNNVVGLWWRMGDVGGGQAPRFQRLSLSAGQRRIAPKLKVVPQVRIELTTYPLPRDCATTTLLRHPWYFRTLKPEPLKPSKQTASQGRLL